MSEAQKNAAQENMELWLSHPAELGKKPWKIECAGEFDLHDLHYYMFKYRKNFLTGWKLGVSGGYEGESLEDCGHVLSEMHPYHPETALQESKDMVEFIRKYWNEQVEAYLQSLEKTE